MNNKILNISFIVFILFLFACKNNSVNPEISSSFMPLHKGNKWFYREYYMTFDSSIVYVSPDLEYDMTEEIVDEKLINNKVYSVIKKRYFDKIHVNKADTYYARLENKKLYDLIKDYKTNKYVINFFADFSIAKGDTFHFEWNGFTYIGEILEKSSSLIKIHYKIPGGADEEFETTFKKNIGLVNSYSTDWKNGMELTKYELK